MPHPNAVASAISGGAGGSAVLAILEWVGLHPSVYVSGLIFTAVSALVLFIGRNGLEGVKNALLHGNKQKEAGP